MVVLVTPALEGQCVLGFASERSLQLHREHAAAVALPDFHRVDDLRTFGQFDRQTVSVR